MSNRDHYRYRMIDKTGKVKHAGITIDPVEREQRHRQRWPDARMVIEGHRVSEESARAWEKLQRKAITPERKKC